MPRARGGGRKFKPLESREHPVGEADGVEEVKARLKLVESDVSALRAEVDTLRRAVAELRESLRVR